MTTTAGLVLAAGEGRRFGGPKAPYVVDGERLVDRAVRVLREASCDPVVVVLGAWVGEVPEADVVVNDDWGTGMGSSLRRGLEHVATLEGVDDVVVTLVDLPGLTAEAVRRILAARAAPPPDGPRPSPPASSWTWRRRRTPGCAATPCCSVARTGRRRPRARSATGAHAPTSRPAT